MDNLLGCAGPSLSKKFIHALEAHTAAPVRGQDGRHGKRIFIGHGIYALEPVYERVCMHWSRSRLLQCCSNYNWKPRHYIATHIPVHCIARHIVGIAPTDRKAYNNWRQGMGSSRGVHWAGGNHRRGRCGGCQGCCIQGR